MGRYSHKLAFVVLIGLAGVVYAVDQKITELSSLTAPSIDDIVYVVDDPAGTPTSYKTTLQAMLQTPVAVLRVSANGTKTIYPPSADTDAARGTALGTAIAAASAGDVIYLAPGTYARTAEITSIPNNLTIIGSGRGTVITCSDPDIIDVIDVTGLTVKSLRCDGRWNFSGGMNIRFQEVEFDNSGATSCIYNDAGDAADWEFLSCSFIKDNAGDSVVFNGFGERLRFTGCNFWNQPEYALRLADIGASNADTETWSGPIINGCHFRNCGIALLLRGVHDPVVGNCSFEDSGTRAIKVEGGIQTHIVNNTFERNNQTTGDQAAIEWEIIDPSVFNAATGASQGAIIGNQIVAEDCCILITGTFDIDSEITIKANHFQIDNTTFGVKINSYRAAYFIPIRGNTFTGQNSANTKAVSATAVSGTIDGTFLKIADNDIHDFGTGIELDGITNVLVVNNDITSTTTAQSLLNSATVR